jgi:aminoglycoside 3'-phosphotransferase I
MKQFVPRSIKRRVAGYAWAQNFDGQSGSSVYQLRSNRNQPDLFLKYGSGPAAREVEDEMAKLRWLSNHASVPTVVGTAQAEKEFWLLTSALRGQTAYQSLQSEGEMAHAMVIALVRFLRSFHAIPIDQCPFDNSQHLKMALARRRIDDGLVDIDDFDDERQGWAPEQIWQAMLEKLPLPFDSVVTHGDFSLDNIIVDDGEVVGCIDVGRCGRADRYQDIAILWNCLGDFSPDLQNLMLNEYGLDEIDHNKLEFHLLLDELF